MRAVHILPSKGTEGSIIPSPVWTLPSSFSLSQGLSRNLNNDVSNPRGFRNLSITSVGAILPAGVSLIAGVLSVAAYVSAGDIAGLRFQADDGFGGIGLSVLTTLTVTSSGSALWLSLPTLLYNGQTTAGFEFTEGVPQTVFVDTLVTGNPALIFINRPPTEEFFAAGVSFGKVNNRYALIYDGTPGLGAIENFWFGASDGARTLSEDEIIPYAAAIPYVDVACGPAWNYYGDNGQDGNATEGGTAYVIPHSAHNTAGGMLYENMGGDYWGQSAGIPVAQGGAAWHTISWASGDGLNTVKQVDITTLWQAWERGDMPNFGLWLKCSSGLIDLKSSRYVGEGPSLQVTFTDNSTVSLTSAADVQLNSSTIGVPGGNSYQNLQVSSSANGPYSVIFFNPMTLAQNKRVKQVLLSVKIAATYSTTGTIGLYALRWQQRYEAALDGIAANHANDQGWDIDPSCFSFQDWNAPGTYGDGVYAWLATNKGSANTTINNAGWAPMGGNEGTSDPLIAAKAIVGPSDAREPGYAPPIPGMNFLRFWIAAGVGAGGYVAGFFPYAIAASVPPLVAGQSLEGDARELWVSMIQMLGPHFDVGFIGGHNTGMGLRYEVQDTLTVPPSQIPGGRHYASPLRRSVPMAGLAGHYWQSNSTKLEGIFDPDPQNITSIAWTGAANNVVYQDPWGYRRYAGYAYSTAQYDGAATATLTSGAATGATQIFANSKNTQAGWFYIATSPIGIVLDTGTTFWTTLVGPPSGSTSPYTFSLVDPLPSPAAAGNQIKSRGNVNQQPLLWSNHARGLMRKMRPYVIEYHIRMNTWSFKDGRWWANQDGLEEIEINGRLAKQRSNWAIGRDPGFGVTDFFLEIYGPSKTSGQGYAVFDQQIYWGPVVVASQRVGPRYYST